MAHKREINRDLLPDPVDYYAHKLDGWKMSGSNRAKALCPINPENTASFFVWLDTGRFKCFSCNHSGDIITFHMHYNNMTFWEACLDLGLVN